MQPYNFIYFLFEGNTPLRCADSPLCGYAATEGGKAEQVMPERRAEPVGRVDAPEAAMSPIGQEAEPEPFSRPICSLTRRYSVTITGGGACICPCG